jgi:nuclear transport factor 2 (NTF2) superfamily protein
MGVGVSAAAIVKLGDVDLVAVAFLKRNRTKDLDYRFIKELWAFEENRIAVHFAYEWHADSGKWFRY